MAMHPLRAFAFCATAAVLAFSGSTGVMATIAGGPNAGDQAAMMKTTTPVIQVSTYRRPHNQGHWNGHRDWHRGDHDWHRGYRGWRGGYRGWGYVAPYWGYPGYYYGGDPYFYYGGPPYDNYSPPDESQPVTSGRCSYWHQQCVKNWGSANSNYTGCMRYEKCAP